MGEGRKESAVSLRLCYGPGMSVSPNHNDHIPHITGQILSPYEPHWKHDVPASRTGSNAGIFFLFSTLYLLLACTLGSPARPRPSVFRFCSREWNADFCVDWMGATLGWCMCVGGVCLEGTG